MASTGSSNSISSLYTTSSSSKRVSGLMSGLDTDTLVQQLSSGYQSKINKVSQNKQKTVWRQESYRTVISAMQEFQKKYLASSSTTSILNRSFYNTSSITNTSSALKVSGSAAAAKNMVVSGITSLARQATMTSSKKVSAEALSTGTINESWTANVLSGTSITINVNGNDTKLSVASDFVFDKTDDVQSVIDQLNYQVSVNSSLKGKVAFSLQDGQVTLSAVDAANDALYIKDGSEALLKGLGLSKSDTAAPAVTGGAVSPDAFFSQTIAAGSKLTFDLDGRTYSLSLKSAVSLKDADDETIAARLQGALNNAIKDHAGLSDKLSVTVDKDGSVSFSSTGSLTLTGGSQNLLQGLGLSQQSGSVSGTLNKDALYKSYLVDTLAGSTLTVNLNGVNKLISFKESEKSQYSDAASLKSYLQSKLNNAFGSGKVTVGEESGVLSFKTADDTSVFSLSSSDATGILGKNGALRVYAGDSNRINTKKTLTDLKGSLNTTLADADEYGFVINGKEFTFAKNTSLNQILSTINSDTEANVNITYSSVTDKFTVTAKNGGVNSQVSIADKAGMGNLAEVLFGKEGVDYTVTAGQNAVLQMSFDGNPANAVTITRTENNFTLDGVNFTLLNTTDSTVSADNPIRFGAESNTDDLYDKIKTFVDDYNALIGSIYTLTTESKPTDSTYDPLTDAQREEMTEDQITKWETKAKQGLLKGDTTLTSLSSTLRRAMTDLVSSASSMLSSIGISTESYGKDGKLIIDETKLKAALTEDSERLTSLFAGDDAIGSRLTKVFNQYVGTFGGDGILIAKAGSTGSTTTDNSFFTRTISSYDDQIEVLKERMENQQEYYYSKFTELETYLSKMNAYSSWFSNSSSS